MLFCVHVLKTREKQNINRKSHHNHFVVVAVYGKEHNEDGKTRLCFFRTHQVRPARLQLALFASRTFLAFEHFAYSVHSVHFFPTPLSFALQRQYREAFSRFFLNSFILKCFSEMFFERRRNVSSRLLFRGDIFTGGLLVTIHIIRCDHLKRGLVTAKGYRLDSGSGEIFCKYLREIGALFGWADELLRHTEIDEGMFTIQICHGKPNPMLQQQCTIKMHFPSAN